jgi:hypothetical protein
MMKKSLILFVALMLLMVQQAFSQRVTFTENFDCNTVSYGSTPANAWVKNSNYFMSAPYSYRAKVPHLLGDSVVLVTTQPYDFSNYSNVQLEFSQICKVSPSDKVILQYRVSGQIWEEVPYYTYLGKADNYGTTGFNASSYPEWNVNDSTAMPALSWWKKEVFDVSPIVNKAAGVQFRFILKRGKARGSHVSYGWLLDDIEITVANNAIQNPVVEFVAPFARDTVYTVGPFEINARVASTTTAPIIPPYLVYMAQRNGVIVGQDSIPMTMVSGNSLWKVTLPLFEQGTAVSYSITGRDTTGNQAAARSGYQIKVPPRGGTTGYVIAGTGDITNYQTPINLYYQNSWTRQLYLGSEISIGASGGMITHLAWDYANTEAWTYTNQTCYFKAVDDVDISSTAYVDPVANGATEVWKGTISATAAGWVEITLEHPFILPPGKNLLIYWNHANGSYYSSTYVWNHTATQQNMTVYYQCDCGGTTWDPSNSTGTLTVNRPNARF